jgi:hypothetical protein
MAATETAYTFKKDHKKCARCKKVKPYREFSQDPCQKNGLHPYCKGCVSEYNKKFDSVPENKLKKRERAKKYYWQNKEKCNERNRTYYYKNIIEQRLKRRCNRNNITVEQYNERFSGHDGNCDICGINQKDLTRALFIDHDHKTGKLRGLLCHNCNVLLGHAFDNLDILVAAYSYLNNIAENRRAS